jgi:hypothetical protein
MSSIRRTLLFLLFAWSGLLKAQEIRYVDLSVIQQRTELRHPPAPAANCKEGSGCIGGGSGGGSVGDCGRDLRDPHAWGVYLLGVTPTDINLAEPFEVEFKVLNTGVAPIEAPVSPHLSDLQPSDESVAFSYLSLALVVGGESQSHGPVSTVGFVELYGSTDHDGSVLVLKPGEWIRVRANVKLTSNLCPNTTPTPSIAVHLLGSGRSEQRFHKREIQIRQSENYAQDCSRSKDRDAQQSAFQNPHTSSRQLEVTQSKQPRGVI